MKAARLVERRRPLELADPAPETGVLQPARIVGQTLPLEQASTVLDAMDSYETLGFSVITAF
ncbi:MAG: hypothetical protein ACRDOU_20550 [Streptosporangiaceae bacterium]